VIVELIRQGKKVGVAANSHKAIHNLLDKIEEMADQRGVAFIGVKKSLGEDSACEGRFIHSEDKKENISLDANLLAGTAWLFADDRFDQHLDYLFIDEAGGVSFGFSKPGKGFTHAVNGRTDSLGLRLNQINVFRLMSSYSRY
jgi:uncharacterized protein